MERKKEKNNKQIKANKFTSLQVQLPIQEYLGIGVNVVFLVFLYNIVYLIINDHIYRFL